MHQVGPGSWRCSRLSGWQSAPLGKWNRSENTGCYMPRCSAHDCAFVLLWLCARARVCVCAGELGVGFCSALRLSRPHVCSTTPHEIAGELSANSDRQTDRRRGKHTHRHTQTDRQTDRQTNRHTHTHRHRHAHARTHAQVPANCDPQASACKIPKMRDQPQTQGEHDRS